MIKLKENDLIEFKKVVNSYKKYGDNNLNKFLTNLPNILDKYINYYQLNDISLMKGGRLGLIFTSYSNKYNKDIVIKIIPNFLKVFEIEANAYKNLSSSYMCPLIEINEKDNVIVMDKLDNNDKLDFNNKETLNNYFSTVYNSLSEKNDIDNNNYIDIYTRYYKELRKTKIPPLAEKNIKSGYHRYQKIFNNNKLYLLHGDLHSNNVLGQNGTYKAIDPLGYLAPKEFTFVRFIITELFFKETSQDYLNELINQFDIYFDKYKLLNALYIDACLFLEALLLQIDNYEKLLPKVIEIIDLIETNIMIEEIKEYENSYNITKTRKLIFRS